MWHSTGTGVKVIPPEFTRNLQALSDLTSCTKRQSDEGGRFTVNCYGRAHSIDSCRQSQGMPGSQRDHCIKLIVELKETSSP